MKKNLEDKCEVKKSLELTLPSILNLVDHHYKQMGCYSCNGYDKTKICYLEKNARR